MIRFQTHSGTVDFQPADPNRVTMWVCGPTVYAAPHLGNARSAVVFDVLYRLLRNDYGRDAVLYARNYTDIDDKIITVATNSGKSVREVTDGVIGQFQANMASLNVLTPSRMPRATEYLSEMSRMIERLVARTAAYVAEGHVLFRVESSEALTDLTGEVSRIAGARVAVESYKQDPRDFVLWKPAKPGEPVYEGPFGLPGRPGWHIECSAMVAEELGQTIDIHGGGSDLIFPHHSCEIAQSETLSGQPLARYWLHNGMLTVGGAKMAKSTGNFITVDEALRHTRGEALRYLLLSGHYRQPLDFTQEKLTASLTALNRLYRAVEAVWHSADARPAETATLRALRNDLATPDALAAMHDAASRAFAAKDAVEQSRAKADLLAGGELLGLLTQEPSEWFRGQQDGDLVGYLVDQRELARKGRDWQEADRLRAELKQMGITVEDTAAGPKWHAD